MHFDIKYYYWFSIASFFTVMFGVLLHEGGHYLAYKKIGYNPTLYFNRVTLEEDSTFLFLKEQSKVYHFEISQNKPFKGDNFYYKLSDKFKEDGFWPYLFGPIVTIAFGSLGFLLLLLSFRSKATNQKLNVWQWSFVFLSLFWLRQIVNVLIILFLYFIKPSLIKLGDEDYINYYLNLPYGTSNIVTLIIAMIFMSYLYFKIIPKDIRLTFLVSVFTGGVLGALIWIVWLGNVIII